jgi:hypothetical protein
MKIPLKLNLFTLHAQVFPRRDLRMKHYSITELIRVQEDHNCNNKSLVKSLLEFNFYTV